MSKPFNWIEALKRAAKRKPPIAEREDFIDRAARWPTCACGVLCKALPKVTRGVHKGAPRDRILRRNGLLFTSFVADANYTEALRIFMLIEARAEKLLGKQKANEAYAKRKR